MSGTWCTFCGKTNCWTECLKQKVAMDKERVRDAAPELLVALISCRSRLLHDENCGPRAVGNGQPVCTCGLDEIDAKAEAAIRKAKGEL